MRTKRPVKEGVVGDNSPCVLLTRNGGGPGDLGGVALELLTRKGGGPGDLGGVALELHHDTVESLRVPSRALLLSSMPLQYDLTCDMGHVTCGMWHVTFDM